MDELNIEDPTEDFSSEMSWFGGEDSPSKSCKEDEFIIVPSKDGPNGFKCKLCEVFYPKKLYLKLHIRTHTNEKPFVCDYSNCTKSFARPGIHSYIHIYLASLN